MGSVLVGIIIAGACRRLIRSDMERFFMVIILTTLLMLSCFSGKLAVYLAPTFPFFVYLAVLLLSHFRWNQWLALTLLLPVVVFVAGLPALIVLGRMPGTEFLGQKLFYVAGGILTVSGGTALYFLYRKKSLNKTINVLALGLFVLSLWEVGMYRLLMVSWVIPSYAGKQWNFLRRKTYPVIVS